MDTLVPLKKTSSSVKIQIMGTRLLEVPPSFFSISMGLAGLAGVWRQAGNFYTWPRFLVQISRQVQTVYHPKNLARYK